MKSINSKINQDITKYLKSIGLSNKQIKAGGYFSKKILDSLEFMKLLIFIQKKYKFKFKIKNLYLKNFDNFNTIIKNIVNEKK